MSDRNRRSLFGAGAPRSPGQALVEFSIALIPFMLLLMGVLDLGRAIYQMNTTSEAAREIARVTSVHRCSTTPCSDLGDSSQTQALIDTQKGLIPGLVFNYSSDIDCVDAADNVIPDDQCVPKTDTEYFIRVHVRSTYSPVTPLLGVFGNHTFESWSRIRL
jgi:TadE-like protein